MSLTTEFSNDIKENEFVRLLNSVIMSVPQVVAAVVCCGKAICCVLNSEGRYHLKAEVTNVCFCQTALRLILVFPRQSRQSEMWRTKQKMFELLASLFLLDI